ncbi:MAG: hypothetical protein SPE78_00800, partial [Actinobacillus minor]|nr:hypothetical protein [Actinobacillus minor]
KPYTSRIGLLNLSRSAALFSAPAGLGLMNLARLVLGYCSNITFVSNLKGTKVSFFVISKDKI